MYVVFHVLFFSLPILQLFCNVTYGVISTKTAANHVYVVLSFRGVYLRCGSVFSVGIFKLNASITRMSNASLYRYLYDGIIGSS